MITTPPTLIWASDDPIAGRLVVVGCSRRKTDTVTPVPALELYQGGCVPHLRARVGGRAELRARVRILSAEHGLVDADTPLLPYDRMLTAQRAVQLRAEVGARLLADFAAHGVPHEVLLVAEPLYLQLAIGPFVGLSRRPALILFTSPVPDWDRAAQVMNGWGWP
jgi:hypothetical protein